MDPFRQSAGTFDRTEIERAKIHEVAETKRKLIEEREETKRKAMEGPEYGLGRFFAMVMVVAACVTTGIIVTSYISSRSPQAVYCHDEVHPVDGFSAQCSHPQHVSTVKDKQLVCVCRGATPAPSGSP